jgi:tol-pal system protein YbgF
MSSNYLRSFLLALVVSLGAGGCANQLMDVRTENQRLTGAVGALRAEKRRAERRVRELENENMLLRDRAETGAIIRDRTGEVVTLPVEVLAPSTSRGGGGADPAAVEPDLAVDERVVDVTPDGTAIIYADDALYGRSREWSNDTVALEPAADDGEDVDGARAAPPAPRRHERIVDAPVAPRRKPAPRAVADAGPAYRAAVDLLKLGQHEQAVTALRSFLEAFPGHEYADNAQYWLGEAFYDRKEYDRALVEFRATVTGHPKGNKVPDALLKIGYCYLAMGQVEKARFALEQVVTIYPRTEPADLASQRLETIAK